MSKPTSAPYTLKFAPPKGMEDPEVLRRIGLQIGEMIDACETEKENFTDTWEQVDRAYRNTPEESLEKPWPTAPTYHIPVLQPRIDRATAFIAGPLTAAMPWWMVRASGPASQRLDPIETILHYHLHKAKYPLHLRQGLDLAQLRGKSVLQPYFEAGDGAYASGLPQTLARDYQPGVKPKGKRPKLCIRAIDIKDHVVYPNFSTLIEDCIMTGHRYEKPLQWVQERQDEGSFFPEKSEDGYHVKVKGGSQIRRGGGDASLDRNSQADNATRPEHEAVEIYQVTARLDPLKTGKAEWLLIDLYRDTNEILKIERYRYSRPWYFDLAFKFEYGRFLNENSRGRNLMGPQFFTNDTVNMQVWGSYYAMLPAVFGQRWALPEDVSAIKPGMVVPMEGGGPVSTVQGHFDPGAFPALTQLGRMMADDVGGVSAQGLGGPLRQGSTTATESQNAAQGQMTGVEEDSTNACFGLTDMIEFIVGDLLYEHYDQWAPAYQGVLPDTKKEEWAVPFWFEANGQTPLNTPQAMQQQLQGLTQLLQGMAQALGPGAMMTVAQSAPDLPMDLLRIAVEATTFSGKETLIPSKDEIAARQQQQQEMMNANAQANGGALPGPGMGMPQGPMDPSGQPDPGSLAGNGGPIGLGMGPGGPAGPAQHP